MVTEEVVLCVVRSSMFTELQLRSSMVLYISEMVFKVISGGSDCSNCSFSRLSICGTESLKNFRFFFSIISCSFNLIRSLMLDAK
ncbi:hypothetical protein GDO81_026805 [Engystomops pustulosus]|uniref:Uncharacterized protein n=1 Tax=Engystomops pustulosus TaxID=76066 RepID=A0AAV6YM20_ENGPU|nr:hypothetical protein GDO81_026805 [Engystomops pustulosus]